MDYCSSPKVLLLGISYPDVWGHMAEHKYSEDVLQEKELSVDQAVECVRRKILTEMDGRDLARCVATEKAGGGHEVYTVSKEMGGIYRQDRHVYASFNNSRGMRKAMASAFGHVRFQQVILDYYWMPTGWLVTRWNKTLFQETLPDLVKYDMLAYPGSRQKSPKKRNNKLSSNRNGNSTYNVNVDNKIYNKDLHLEEGVVFLPFCAHVCKELVGGIHKLKPYYAITFVKKSELPGHALWKGTMMIDGSTMQHRLGKRLDQEEVYCTFQPKDIYESMEDAHVNKDEVMEMLLSIEDFESIRMIRLRPLRQHEPPSVFRKVVVEPETGGFIGLNWETGKKRFKEYKMRGRNKPAPPPPPPKVKTPKATTKSTKPKKAPKVDSDSECHTDFSDSEDTLFDTESDSSSDESENESEDAELCNKHKDFDPYDPERIPQTTHYFPYPALDIQSYMVSKDVEQNDKVMAYYAKQWGPKCARKKNKKQDIAKQDYQRFREKQRDYMSTNPRMPVDRDYEEGYKWTLVGSDSERDSDSDSDGESNIRLKRNRIQRGGWTQSLKGDDPDAHLEPRIVELAKRDNEMAACMQLFEMKNPGFKKFSRTWANDASYMSCYKIPKESVLIKMDAAEKARKVLETKTKTNRHYSRQNEVHEYEDYVDESASVITDTDEARRNLSPELCRFADIAANAPVLSEEMRLLCQESKGIAHSVPTESVIPPFRPKMVSNKYSPYNLAPHKDFPRELFRLLQDAKERILNHIVRWQKRGRSFVIKNHEEFEKIVLRQCCIDTETTYQSFLKTIIGYGFVQIRVGKRKGGYRHNLFQRGKPKRLDQLIQEGVNNLLVDGEGEEPEAVNDSFDEEPKATRDISSRKMFIENLYQLLRKSPSLGFDDAIHWEENGKSFKVYKLNEKLSTRVLQSYLSIARYSLFKKELVDRGFKCKEGMKYGIFEHPDFARGQRGVSKSFKPIHLKRRTIIEPKVREESVSSSDLQTPKRRTKQRKIGEESASSSENKSPKSDPQPPTKRKRLSGIQKKRSSPSSDANDPVPKPASSKRRNTRLKIEREDVSSNASNSPKTEPQAPKKTKRQVKKEVKYDLSHNCRTKTPQRLYDMLEESKANGFSECMRWLPEGDGFYVEPISFLSKVLSPRARIQTYATFERKLMFLGFQKSDGANSGIIYKHPHFVRGQRKNLRLVPQKDDEKIAPADANPVELSMAQSINGDRKSPKISDLGQTTPSPSESSEKENSDDHPCTATSSTKDENAMDNHRHKTPTVMNKLSVSSKGKKSIPPASTKSPNAKKSKKRSRSAISTAVTEYYARSKKSSGTPTAQAPPRNKNGRFIKRNGICHKPARKGSKKVSRGASGAAVSVGASMSQNSDARDQSSQEGDVSSPASGRGLRSSTKVCGINTMNSMTAGSHLLAVSKCKLEDDTSSAGGPLILGGIRNKLIPLSPPPDSFPAACSIDRQVIPIKPPMFPERTRLEIGVRQVSFGETGLRQPASIRRREDTNAITVTPPRESAEDMLRDRLSSIGLSLMEMQNVISIFVDSFGENRAIALEAIIYRYAGIPICDQEIIKLDEWIPDTPTPTDETFRVHHLLHRCLLIEVCFHEISRILGNDWCKVVSAAMAANPLHPIARELRRKVHEICSHLSSQVAGVHRKIMSSLTNNRVRELKLKESKLQDEIRELERMECEHRQQIRREQIRRELERAECERRQQKRHEQEFFRSNNSNSNSNQSMSNGFHRQLQHSLLDRNQRVSIEAAAQNQNGYDFESIIHRRRNNHNHRHSTSKAERTVQKRNGNELESILQRLRKKYDEDLKSLLRFGNNRNQSHSAKVAEAKAQNQNGSYLESIVHRLRHNNRDHNHFTSETRAQNIATISTIPAENIHNHYNNNNNNHSNSGTSMMQQLCMHHNHHNHRPQQHQRQQPTFGYETFLQR